MRAPNEAGTNRKMMIGMRRSLPLVALALLAISCTMLTSRSTPTVLEDTYFAGRAYVDLNGNGKLDEGDAPLPGAQFIVGGFGSQTDANGSALVIIPGRWDQAVTARMSPPEGSGYTLIGPAEATLQSGEQTSADFLFAVPPGGSFTPNVQTTETTPVTTQANITLEPGAVMISVPYCTAADGTRLTMDIYQPFKREEPTSAIIYVHGGGWVSGDKSDGVGALFIPELRRRGYVVFSVNYRLAPSYSFPAQIEDVKCAVRHVRANAAQYNIDAVRLGAIGGSAGGHLVALLGLTDTSAGWDVGEYTDQSSGVQAVVDLFGPTDLMKLLSKARRPLGEQVFGVSGNDDPHLQTYSPITYITPKAPPFLIMQGEQDELVPLEQSQILYDRLKAAGVSAQLVLVKNAGHSFLPVGGDLDPSVRQLIQMAGDFFDQYLK
jgi:acetyl esterase/lipase